MKRTLFSFLILLIATTVFAQDKQWTLNECMRYAVEHNPRVHKQEAQNSATHQSYLEAIGRFLPDISGSTSANMNFGRALGNDNTYVNVNNFSNNYSLSGSLTLFDGFANINNLKMQRINKVQGKHQLENNKDKVAYETMEAYLNVLYYQSAVKVSAEQLAESKNQLHRMERMEELGLSGSPDVAEAVAKEAEDTYNLTRQKNILTIGIIILKERMNYPIDEELIVEDYTSQAVVAHTLDKPLDIYAIAVDQLPEALSAKSSAEATKYAYRSAKGVWAPRISMSGGYSTSFFRIMGGDKFGVDKDGNVIRTVPTYRDQLKDKQGQYVGFNLSIPIFNGFRRSSSVKKSRVQMIIAQSDREEILRKVYSDIEQAVADVNGQADEYKQAKKQAEAMQVAHDANKRKYEEGLISAIDLSTSSNRVIRTKMEELNSLYKYQLKNRLLEYYKGKPYIEQ